MTKLKRQILGTLSLFVVLLLLNIPLEILSQSSAIDSLQGQLATELSDTSKVKILNELSYLLLKSNSLDAGFETAEKALAISQENNYSNGIANAYSNIGLYFDYSNDYQGAISNYSKAYQVCSELGDKCDMARQYNNIGSIYREMASYDTALNYFLQSRELLSGQDDSAALANTLNLIGLVYNSKGDFNKSLQYLLESLNIWECSNDKKGMGSAYCNIGMVYRRIGEYEKALNYLEKTLAFHDETNSERAIIESYIQIGIVYEETGEYDKAIASYKKGLEIATRLNYKKKIAGCLNNIGVVYYDIGKTELALEYYFKSLEIKQRIGDKHGITVTTNNIALAYLDLIRLKESSHPGREIKHFGSYEYIIQLLLESVKLAEETSNYQDLSNTYNSLVIAYANNEQYENAVAFQEKLMVLNDSVFTIDKNKNLVEIQAQFEAEQKEQQIEILNAKNTAQMLKMKRQDRERYYYLGGGVMMLIVVVGLMTRMNFVRRTRNQLQFKSKLIEAEKLRAEESEKVKEQFLSRMSYEIRTPMNSVMGMADILINNDHSKVQSKYLEAVKQSSENLMVIINDILDFSNLESGNLELEKSDFVLSNEIKNVYEILRFKAKEKKLKLQYELDQNIPEVLIGDKTRLTQILINLVGNAIKFTKKGNVKINVKQINKENTTVRILFEVVDEGIGIPEDKLEKIFESFTQAESDTSHHYGGTGLGLSISKHLVQLQDGLLSVRSTVGEGSTFWFELPFEIGESRHGEIKQVTRREKLSDISVLVAEDNEFNAMVVKDELESQIENVKIEIAENGKEAMQFLNKSNFDIILMDIEMPEMNGCEASMSIRKLQSEKSKIPILAMTANASKEDVEKCYEHGIDDVITKPFNAEELMIKITALVT